jgi:peptide deformylase
MSQDSKSFIIEKYGSAVLRTPCSTVTKFDRNLKKTIDKMLKTMYAENGVGLAAPQVGISKRIIVIDTDWPSERYTNENSKSAEPEYNPIIMINPVIVYQEGTIESPEGCLSFPGVFFSVNRAKKIVVKFQDLNGKEHRLEADSDLFCRCVQHEIDHLNGKLFVDIALDKVFAMEELAKFGLGDINSPPPLLL